MTKQKEHHRNKIQRLTVAEGWKGLTIVITVKHETFFSQVSVF